VKTYHIRDLVYYHLLVIFLISVSTITHAQSTQIWADYTLNLPFANNKYLFSTELAYHTDISKESKWREIEVDPIIQWTINHRIDIMFSFKGCVTRQAKEYSTEELRPSLGLRYHFIPHRRIQLRGFFLFEQRNLYHNESSTWSHSLRSRFHVESLFPINRKTMSENKLWYGLADAEAFWVMDNQLEERYSNQMRLRAGIGYKSSHSWRFEILYTSQLSRNNLDQNFQETSNIFRFRLKHFINKE
jgi:hypothetical protein